MKKETKKLLFIAIVALVGFLVAYGKVFYECGANGGLEGLAVAFVFPVFYLILTVTAFVMMHKGIVNKIAYIVMAVISTGVMAIAWIVFLCVRGNADETMILWYPIVLSVLSLIMSACYVSLAVDLIKATKKTANKINEE